MNAVRIGAVVFGAVVGMVAGWLAWQNRESETVATNFPTFLAISAVGALLTLAFSLHGEEKAISFPVEYVIDLKTDRPLSCEAFPECTQYTDAGALTPFPGWQVAGEVATADPKVIPQDAGGLSRFYRRVILRQILEALRFTFNNSWDAQPSRFELPTGGGSSTLYAARTVRPGRKLTNQELINAFGGDVTVGSGRFEHLNLPPDTLVLQAGHTETASSVKFQNDFVGVTLTITDGEMAGDAGPFRQLCHLPLSEADGFRRPRYRVSLSATFRSLRSGHPDMPLYRHWVETMMDEVQRLEPTKRWERMKDEYLLLYSQRTQTPLKELMDYTLKKAEGQK